MPTPRNFDIRAIDDVAAAQGGVVTYSQLCALGMSRGTISKWTRSGGRWQRLLPAVYLVHRGSPTVQERMHAAQAYAGGDYMFTGALALHLHGLRNLPVALSATNIHVLIPASQQTQSAGFVIAERTRRLPQALEVNGFQVAPIERAIFDAGRRSSDRQIIRAFVLEAIQRRLVSIEQLRTELQHGPRQWTAVLRDVIGEGQAGARSVPEAELRSMLIEAGLPEPLWNPRLETLAGEFIAEPDAYFKDFGLALEVDSWRYHYENADHFTATWRRHGRYTRHGIVVLRLIPIDIRNRPTAVLEIVRATLDAQAGKPAPQVRVIRGRN